MAEHNDLGWSGEDIAVDFLIKNKVVILERNFRFKSMEIDIIGQKDNVLLIIEVKTRSGNDFAFPRDSINISKQKRLFNAGQAFIEIRNLQKEVRFDIVEILIFQKIPKINWIQDAFRPGW